MTTEWIPHDGGPCFLAEDTLVKAEFNDGYVTPIFEYAGDLVWSNIVEYLIKETAPTVAADPWLQGIMNKIPAAPVPQEGAGEGELLPCPFCGGKVHMTYAGSSDWDVECQGDCPVSTHFWVNANIHGHGEGELAEARRRWNTRTISTQSPKAGGSMDAILDKTMKTMLEGGAIKITHVSKEEIYENLTMPSGDAGLEDAGWQWRQYYTDLNDPGWSSWNDCAEEQAKYYSTCKNREVRQVVTKQSAERAIKIEQIFSASLRKERSDLTAEVERLKLAIAAAKEQGIREGMEPKKLHDILTKEVAATLNYFDSIEGFTTLVEFQDVARAMAGGEERYRSDYVFNAKVKSMTAHLLMAIASPPNQTEGGR